jgi:transposase, IS30 family
LIDIQNMKLAECEALSHWIDPRYGFLSPGKFIPALEANREVYKVDCHALEGYGQDAEFLREKAIARELNCSPSTVGYELKRGTVSLYTGNVKRYKAVEGQSTYELHRSECGRKSLFLRRHKFIDYVSHCFHNQGWSLDACVGYALAKGIFQKDQVVSTKTLYNYVDLGLMDIKNGDLPEKVKRNTKTRRARVNKRILGRSIDERSPRIESRKDFGHWECDLVLGHKTKDKKKSSPSALTFPEQTWKPAIFTKRSKTPLPATGSAAIKFILRLRKVPSMTAARPWSKPSSTSMTWGYQVWMDDFGSGYFP